MFRAPGAVSTLRSPVVGAIAGSVAHRRHAEAGRITEVAIHIAGRSRKSVAWSIGKRAAGIAVGFDGAPIDLATAGVTVR